MAKHVLERVSTETYTFGDLVLISNRYRGVYRTTWYVVCQQCEQRLLVTRVSQKHWIARCHNCKLEYAIAPAEYYIMKPADFRRIMGEI